MKHDLDDIRRVLELIEASDRVWVPVSVFKESHGIRRAELLKEAGFVDFQNNQQLLTSEDWKDGPDMSRAYVRLTLAGHQALESWRIKEDRS